MIYIYYKASSEGGNRHYH